MEPTSPLPQPGGPRRRQHPAQGARRVAAVVSVGAFAAITGAIAVSTTVSADTSTTSTDTEVTTPTQDQGSGSATDADESDSWSATPTTTPTTSSGGFQSGPVTQSHGS